MTLKDNVRRAKMNEEVADGTDLQELINNQKK